MAALSLKAAEWRGQSRIWERLHEEHRAKRAEIADDRAFRRWELTDWRPRLKAASVARNAACESRLAELRAALTEDDAAVAVRAEKTAGALDKTLDIDRI